MSEEKEPQDSDSWFSQRIKDLQEVMRKAKENKILAHMTPRERLEELDDTVRRGLRIRGLLEMPVWKLDVDPMLRAEASLKPWKPGDPLRIEEVATQHVYNSGAVGVMSRLLEKFQKAIKAGEQAQEELEKEAEKRKSLDRLKARV